MRVFGLVVAAFLMALNLAPAQAQTARCEIPREARDIWRCENGFVIGPENVIIRLPIPETDPEALYNAGVEAAQREDWRVAIAYFTAAHQRAHLVPRYMYNLGLAHARAGHDLPAVAWLTSFLTAEPEAPNRAEVWVEIERREARVRSNIEALWATGKAAADTLPSTGSYQANRRWMAYGYLALQAATVSDLDRARVYLTERMAFCAGVDVYRDVPGTPRREDCPQSVEHDLLQNGFLQAARYGALLYDYDPGVAEAITAQMGQATQLWRAADYQRELEKARRERLVAITWSYFEPGYMRYRFEGRDHWDDPLDMARAGEWEELAQAAPYHPPTSVLYGLPYQAFLGEVEPLFARLSQAQPTDRGENWEYIASSAGEIFLLRGDSANAQRALAESQRLIRRPTWIGAGYGARRLEALLAADGGRIDEALIALEIASSRTIGSIPGDATAPWLRERGAPPALLAEYFAGRARFAEAFTTIAGADSLRRAAFYDSVLRRPGVDSETRAQATALLAATLNSASQGCVPCVQRRIAIENAVINAANLDGVHSDLAAELRSVSALRDANEQTYRIASDILQLDGARRQIRGLFRRAGGTWGQ